MVQIEFRERIVGSAVRRVIGTLTVIAELNTYTVSGSLPLEELPILDRAMPGGRLWLHDDPSRWARKCHRLFRSGYVVAVRVNPPGLRSAA